MPVPPPGKRGRWPVIPQTAAAFRIGVLDTDLTYRSSATMSVYTGGGGSETDSTENITVWDWLLAPGDSIAAGSNVIAGWNGSAWYVFAAECPDSGSS